MRRCAAHLVLSAALASAADVHADGPSHAPRIMRREGAGIAMFDPDALDLGVSDHVAVSGIGEPAEEAETAPASAETSASTLGTLNASGGSLSSAVVRHSGTYEGNVSTPNIAELGSPGTHSPLQPGGSNTPRNSSNSSSVGHPGALESTRRTWGGASDTVGSPLFFAWALSAWNDCCNTEDGISLKLRTRECKDVFEGVVVDESHCAQMHTPLMQKQCICGEDEPCQAECATAADGSDRTTQDAEPPSAFVRVGCLPNRSFEGRFPFYGMLFSTGVQCGRFCASKGFDVAGLRHLGSAGDARGVGNCSCGSSVVNENALHRNVFALSRFAVRLDDVDPSDEGCVDGGLIYRYDGFYVDRGMPHQLFNITIGDLIYQHTIVQGVRVSEHEEEDGRDRASLAEAALGGQRATDRGGARRNPGWERPCYPDRCGPGLPWPRSANPGRPHHDSKIFQQYVRIDYCFSHTLATDYGRKDAFREAARRWREDTCINLMEVDHDRIPYGEPYIYVDVQDYDYCWADGIGRPRSNGRLTINLGWCQSMNEVGNIVHEIGHAVGLNHEQKRPDGQGNYYGHGPFLNVHWDRIGSDWAFQYEGDPDSYTGSTMQDPRDPVGGYERYDYGSIMHYPQNDAFDLVHAPPGTYVGQRSELSEGDIRQVLDTHQCYEPSTLTATHDIREPGQPALFSLNECEGSCVVDSDCAGEMVCWRRPDASPIPGCDGTGRAGWGYCVGTSNPAVQTMLSALPVDNGPSASASTWELHNENRAERVHGACAALTVGAVVLGGIMAGHGRGPSDAP